MAPPLVSISIVTYNQVEFIRETLSSALDQEYENLEVVIADDASTDGTSEVILEYAKKYPSRLVPVFGRVNLGLTGNSNRALKKCRGRYVAFQGGDDVLLPGKIRKQVDWMEENENRVLCGHDVEVFDSKTGRCLYFWSDRIPLKSGKGPRKIIRYGVPYCATSIMIRSSVLPPYGFDERLPVVSDWKLWIDCLASGGHFGYIDGVYARYRRHSHNITDTHFQIRQDDQFVTLALVESHYPHLVESCRYGRASLFYGVGLGSLLRGERRHARVHLKNAVRQHFHWKAYRALLLTFFPNRFLTSLFTRLNMKHTP